MNLAEETTAKIFRALDGWVDDSDWENHGLKDAVQAEIEKAIATAQADALRKGKDFLKVFAI